MNKRIEKAKQLLINTGLNNMEIARRCGFADTKNLSLNNSKFSINYNRCGKV